MEFILEKDIAFPVPVQSVVYKNGFAEVFVISKGKAKGERVEVVHLDHDVAWIKGKALKNGIKIVTEGAVYLNDGVSIPSSKRKNKK